MQCYKTDCFFDFFFFFCVCFLTLCTEESIEYLKPHNFRSHLLKWHESICQLFYVTMSTISLLNFYAKNSKTKLELRTSDFLMNLTKIAILIFPKKINFDYFCHKKCWNNKNKTLNVTTLNFHAINSKIKLDSTSDVSKNFEFFLKLNFDRNIFKR